MVEPQGVLTEESEEDAEVPEQVAEGEEKSVDETETETEDAAEGKNVIEVTSQGTYLLHFCVKTSHFHYSIWATPK